MASREIVMLLQYINVNVKGMVKRDHSKGLPKRTGYIYHKVSSFWFPLTPGYEKHGS